MVEDGQIYGTSLYSLLVPKMPTNWHWHNAPLWDIDKVPSCLLRPAGTYALRRLLRKCFCVFTLGLCFVCSFVLFDLFVCPNSFMFP